MVVAHQGGWDEMLFVAVPIAIFAGLLWLANRRATAQLRQRQERERQQAAEQAQTAEQTPPRSGPPPAPEPPTEP